MTTPLSASVPTDESALEQWAHNKTIPAELRTEILTALSYYPELKDTEIAFVFSESIKTSLMQAQPKVNTLLRHKKRRGYVIKISRYFHLSTTHSRIEELPKNVLVGWIGHELGHIMDYLNRNHASMARFGIGYLFSKTYIRHAERVADTYAVSHGLREQILATKNFVLDHADLSEWYKRKIRRLYLSPDEIMTIAQEAEEAAAGRPSK